MKLNEGSIEGLYILNNVNSSVTICITIGLGGIFFSKYKKNKLQNDDKNKNKRSLEQTFFYSYIFNKCIIKKKGFI